MSRLILPHVTGIIHRFLGLTAALDSIRILVINPEQSLNSSGIPHHDSVGHRLKLFVPLRLNNTTLTPTYYVRQRHLRTWRSFTNPVRADQTRITQFWNPSDVSTLFPNTDNAYIFDTNGVHWGSYFGLELPRIYLVFEFSTIKSYFVRGCIGPSIHYSKKLIFLLRKFKLLPFHLYFLS